MTKKMIGWREWAALPELGIERIKVKVDTGARTSALHAFKVESFSQDGIAKVRFSIHPDQHDLSIVKECVANLLGERNVTDSGGHTECRPVILTSIRLAKITKNITITLTNRDTMKFRMLLGRTAMDGDFIVDPQLSYLCGEI